VNAAAITLLRICVRNDVPNLLVRHAESVHNANKDFSQRDPPLTPLGISQASHLVGKFPDPSSVVAVITSPLTRASVMDQRPSPGQHDKQLDNRLYSE